MDPFDELRRHRAGDARKPALDENAGQLLDFEQRLIRVLDDDGRAVGPWAEALPDGALLDDELLLEVPDFMAPDDFMLFTAS